MVTKKQYENIALTLLDATDDDWLLELRDIADYKIYKLSKVEEE